MTANFFTELSIVIAIGAGVSLFMRIIKQPLIIGYILTGLLVGSSFLNIVNNNQTINVFANIGIALLLFIIGLGLNPKIIKEVGKVSTVAGGIQMVLTTLLGFVVGRLFGYTKTASVIIGLALAFSSTIIVLKLLNDKKEQTRLYGKITIGILLIQDIVAAVALILITARSEGNFSVTTLIDLAIKGGLMVLLILLTSHLILPKFHKLIAGSQEFLFLFAIGWGFGLAALFEHFGFSIEVGALFAGIALANLPYAQEIASRLRPLRDFFVIVFFIALGTQLNFNHFNSILWPVIIFSLIVVLVKPFVTLGLMGLLGYTKNTSFKTSSTMTQISEFSLVLVLLAKQQGLINSQVVDIITITALITIAISAYIITYSQALYTIFEHHLVLFEKHKTKTDGRRIERFDMVLFGYKKGGSEFIKVMNQMKKRIIVVDYDPEVIDSLTHQNINFVYGDATDIELLDEIQLLEAKMVVSTISDYPTNLFLSHWLDTNNQQAVFVCAAETPEQASELYNHGVAYVMMPHYIGSEKISSFIKRHGFNKTEFRKFREKHLLYLQTHYN